MGYCAFSPKSVGDRASDVTSVGDDECLAPKVHARLRRLEFVLPAVASGLDSRHLKKPTALRGSEGKQREMLPKRPASPGVAHDDRCLSILICAAPLDVQLSGV